MYAGKRPNRPNRVNSNTFKLIRLVSDSGQNITCDNCFTSIPLTDDLLNNHNLPMVETLQKNKKEILPIFLQNLKGRPIESNVFGFKNDMILVLYKPKTNKIV